LAYHSLVGLLRALLRWLGEALVRLYYPNRVVEGAERIPAGKPIVFVLNHPNGLLDPVLLRIAMKRPARFLAKSTLFGNPLGRLAMNAFGSIPIYRAHESGARAADASRNDESFARCRAELAAGGSMALFPEGVSHSDPQMRPLKTGAARIALSAEAEHDGKLGVTLVPVGLHYEHKTTFRSSVLLVVGEPIEITPLLADYRRDERATVNALTERIDARLDEVVLQAESREIVEGIARVARWTAAPGDPAADPNDPGARNRRARELAAAYARMRARDPARVEAIVAEARRYRKTLWRLGVRDPWALELTSPRVGATLGAVARLALAAPVALVGALMGWGPYRLAGRVAGRITKDDDVLGTVKLFAGVAFLFVAWLAEAIAVGLWARPIWILPTFVLGVASGYVALRFDELWHEAAEAWRHVALRAFRFSTAQKLVERRRELADTVARALEEAS
jgi:1-acyl-sn-glycerol-3-phosphate acyltransferase